MLGGCKDTKLLNVRLFDKYTMRKVYEQQTIKAKKKGLSNCPYCAIGHDNNRDRIWKLNEMDADHVCARHIIGLRGINSRNNNLTNFKKLRKGWGCVKIDESRYA